MAQQTFLRIPSSCKEGFNVKKRTFILFEILIALSLTAVLLTFLFSFFVESARIEKKLDTARMAVSNRAHLQTRLQTVFGSLDPNGLYTQQFEKEKNLSLIATFNNGIDPDPAYSGSILSRIFLDEEKNLCLVTWPLDQESHPWRKEVLLAHVEHFEFEFLGENGAHKGKEKIRPITPNLAWRSHWEGKNPSIIRLKVREEKQKEPLQFAFLLLTTDFLVTYAGRKTG